MVHGLNSIRTKRAASGTKYEEGEMVHGKWRTPQHKECREPSAGPSPVRTEEVCYFLAADFDAYPVYMSERAGMALISLVSRSAAKSR